MDLGKYMIKKSLLDNGLTVVTESMPHVRSVAVGVWLRRGSRHEHSAKGGISHFIEHMVFKGTSRRTQAEIAQEMDAIGGQTTPSPPRSTPASMRRSLDEHLPQVVDLLADIVLDPSFDEEELEREAEGRFRRDQDGRGHARRPGPRDLHRVVLAESPPGASHPGHAGDGRSVGPRPASEILPGDLHTGQPDRLGGGESGTRGCRRAHRPSFSAPEAAAQRRARVSSYRGAGGAFPRKRPGTGPFGLGNRRAGADS